MKYHILKLKKMEKERRQMRHLRPVSVTLQGTVLEINEQNIEAIFKKGEGDFAKPLRTNMTFQFDGGGAIK